MTRLSRGSERLRKMMEMVKRGQKTLIAASMEQGIGYRQTKRIYRLYAGGGVPSASSLFVRSL